MQNSRKHKGPWTHRLMVYVFSILFAVLVYWLLGFVVRDIGTWPGPNYKEVEEVVQDPSVLKELETLRTEIEDVQQSIDGRKQRQTVLRDSTSNSERTMNQLLELQKLTLQQGLKPSEEESRALAQSEELFLTNQVRYQEINDQVGALSDQLLDLRNRERAAQRQVEAKRPAVQEEYSRLESRHQWKLAAIKLGVLSPLLLVAGWLFLTKRGSLYVPLIYGYALALVVKTGMVMHEHFPKRYFKYILILLALGIVARVLVYLLRATAFPKTEWLLKQYREAYERFLCPVCGYPIRRGPLKYMFWNRSSIKRLKVLPEGGNQKEEPYACPSCGTRLFEPCADCKEIRHSLLPACAHCGSEKSIPARGGIGAAS